MRQTRIGNGAAAPFSLTKPRHVLSQRKNCTSRRAQIPMRALVVRLDSSAEDKAAFPREQADAKTRAAAFPSGTSIIVPPRQPKGAAKLTLPVMVTVFDSPEESITCEEAKARERFDCGVYRVLRTRQVGAGKRRWRGLGQSFAPARQSRPSSSRTSATPAGIQLSAEQIVRLSVLGHMRMHKGGAATTRARMPLVPTLSTR